MTDEQVDKPGSFLSAHSSEWTDLDNEGTKSLGEELGGLLASENLAVLSGLGTSRSLVDSDLAPVAPQMSDLWTKAKDIEDFEHVSSTLPTAATADENFETLLSACNAFLTVIPDGKIAGFVSMAEAMVVSSCNFITDDLDLSVHEQFLRKIATRDPRLPRVQIFTTNYDRVLEVAAANAGFSIIDGFRLDAPRRFDGGIFDLDYVRRTPGAEISFEANVIRLLKLHGSIDWDRQDGSVRKSDAPTRPALIFPRDDKFQHAFQNPYLECIARFQTTLRSERTVMIVAGSGLNDEHLAGPIRSALESNSSLRVLYAAPSARNPSNPTVKLMERLVRAGDRRIILLAADFNTLVRCLPDARAESDEQIHRSRFTNALREAGLADA